MAAPSYPLTMPSSPGFVSSVFEPERRNVESVALFTGRRQVQIRPYALWRATVRLPLLSRAQVGQWQSFIMQLEGKRGTFYFSDPDRKAPLGGINRDGVVATNAAIGSYDLAITVPSATTGGLLAGDYIQIGDGATAKLHKVVADASPSGTALFVSIQPALKVAVAANTAVRMLNPVGVFSMTTDTIGWSADHLSRHTISFSCREHMG